MNESQLYRYALLACIIGFFVLGYVVLFIPVSFDDEKVDFIDGMVVNVFPSDSGGQIIIISQVGEKTLFLDEETDIALGGMYRFYSPKGDDLLIVEAVRSIT